MDEVIPLRHRLLRGGVISVVLLARQASDAPSEITASDDAPDPIAEQGGTADTAVALADQKRSQPAAASFTFHSSADIPLGEISQLLLPAARLPELPVELTAVHPPSRAKKSKPAKRASTQKRERTKEQTANTSESRGWIIERN